MKQSTPVLPFLLLFFLNTICLTLYAADLQGAEISPVKDFRESSSAGGSSSGHGTTYYISKGGNDNASGVTPAKAWKTVKKVNNSTFSPGDSVLFKRGHRWRERLIVPNSGNATGHILFGAYGSGNKPILDGTNLKLPKWGAMISSRKNNYIILENLRVTNVGIEYPTRPNSTSGINISLGNQVIVRNCEIHNTTHSGLTINTVHNILIESNKIDHACMNPKSPGESLSFSNSWNFEIRNNIIHDNGQDNNHGGSGIDVKNGSHDGTIHHNEVYNMYHVNHIYIDAFKKHTYNIEIYNNFIHDGLLRSVGLTTSSEQGGLLENIRIHHNILKNLPRGITIHPGRENAPDPVKNLFFYNNTLVNCGNGNNGSIYFVNRDTKNINVKNNIFSMGEGFQIGFKVSQKIPRNQYHINYNVIHGVVNTPGTKAIDGIAGNHPILENPLFTGFNNFHLQAQSPAKNACDNSVWRGTPNISDYDGTPITNNHGNIIAPGGRVSCGAYE